MTAFQSVVSQCNTGTVITPDPEREKISVNEPVSRRIMTAPENQPILFHFPTAYKFSNNFNNGFVVSVNYSLLSLALPQYGGHFRHGVGFEGKKVWLLLGGRDKGGSYERLIKEIRERCRGVCIFGEARHRILEAIRNSDLDSSIEILEGEDLEESFAAAAKRAKPGEVVLLSPACSSFDQYRSYAERGDHFKQLVKRWKILNN